MRPRLLRSPWFLGALLFAATALLYARTRTFEFLNYDDDVYVVENEHVRAGLTAASVRWAFTSGEAANWHPLTWLSHELDVELFQLDAGAHHLVNAGLHALAALLAFGALRALTGATEKSALAAALFALHPLRVESVAWVAERKDVLAGALALATLWTWAGYARRGGAGRYLASLALFATGLLAKPTLVTLPCVLLLLDLWPLGRWRGRAELARLVREKLPFFALAGLSCYVTWRVQRAGGAFGPLDVIGPQARLANAGAAYATYVGKTLWPSGLCAFYPHPAATPGSAPWSAGAVLGLAFLVAASALALRLRRRAPAVIVGWLWFLGMLVPVIGIVQVGLQAWADRYSYLPGLGLVVALVWGVDALVTERRLRAALAAVALLALVPLTLASVRQIDTWRDSRTLFTRALAVTEQNFLAHANLGQALLEQGEDEVAEAQFAAVLALRPQLVPARLNHARALRGLGRTNEARAELELVLRTEPESVEAESELGWLLSELGQDAEALPHLRAAVARAPDDLKLVNNLAWVLATSRTRAAPEEALALAEELCRRTRDRQLGFLEVRAAALARLGRFEEAVQWQARVAAGVPAAFREPQRQRLELYRAGQPFLKSP